MIDPDHPALREPGHPGDLRYACPFCPWFLDRGSLSSITIELRLEAHLLGHVDEMTTV